MMQPQPQSSQQLTLFQVESQVDQYVQYTMVEQSNTLARMLAKRELPMFYFAEAGEELGVTAKTCRAWKMNIWPAANRPSDDKLMYKTAIYLRVFLRLSTYPENETYANATIRLHQQIAELEEGNFSRNQIAQQMRMSFRTLKDLCDRAEREETEGRSSHCPWKLLERLGDAENEITRQKERQAEFQDLRVLHPESNHRGNGDRTRPPDHPERHRGERPMPEMQCRMAEPAGGRDRRLEPARDGLHDLRFGKHHIPGARGPGQRGPRGTGGRRVHRVVRSLPALPGLLEPHETGKDRPVEQCRLHLPEMRHGEPVAAQTPENPDLLTERRTI